MPSVFWIVHPLLGVRSSVYIVLRRCSPSDCHGRSSSRRPRDPAAVDAPCDPRQLSQNSIPPERVYGVFSILNDTFDDDQRSALADYIELALQLQFNERSRKKEVS